jgi:hypothetical protein
MQLPTNLHLAFARVYRLFSDLFSLNLMHQFLSASKEAYRVLSSPPLLDVARETIYPL